jgi:hypothetical protein
LTAISFPLFSSLQLVPIISMPGSSIILIFAISIYSGSVFARCSRLAKA